MSIHASLLPARTSRSAFGKLLRSEILYAWRVPLGLLLGVAVPALMVIVFGTLPATNEPMEQFGGLSVFATYFPAIIAFTIAVFSLLSFPTHLANYREQGILQRLSTTPVPPAWILAAQFIVNFGIVIVALGILVAGATMLGLGAPKAPGGFVLALVLTVAAMFAIGLWISAVARTQSIAGAIGQLFLYPLLFFAGLYVPRAVLPAGLRNIGDYTPLGAAAQALQDAMHGTFPTSQSLLVMAAWTVVFGVLAARFFRWD